MFSTAGLFQKLQCPIRDNCHRVYCPFSHLDADDLPPQPQLAIPVNPPSPKPSSSKAPTSPILNHVTSVKRTTPHTPRTYIAGTHVQSIGEPPRKLQRLSAFQKSPTVPTASHTFTGVPVLRVNAAQSKVAIPVRQTMLKSLYDHFVSLYEAILADSPALASEHALRQELEVYDQSTKHTYRNAVITSIAALKRRSPPDSVSHPSVGTEGDLRAREELRKSSESIHLVRSHVESLMLTVEGLQKWGYVVEVPEGPGGDKPHEEGGVKPCVRCSQMFAVEKVVEAEECNFHWGRPLTTSIQGEKIRIYSCCSRPISESSGCVRGPHVFYEAEPSNLHSRHPFSCSRPPTADDTAFDVVALDCEMIYTTSGMSVARVSVVDGTGREVFDQFVKMAENVEVVDYNTRFSGITRENHANAVLPLSAIRSSLDAYINSDTIILGHALENDLKALRMVHYHCVDTAVLFPHKAGPPYRRALRDLVKEHLGKVIQAGGGTVGHSSVEDSIATLDLVKWYLSNKPKTNRPNSNAPVVHAVKNRFIRTI